MRSHFSFNKLSQELGIHPHNFTAPPNNAKLETRLSNSFTFYS